MSPGKATCWNRWFWRFMVFEELIYTHYTSWYLDPSVVFGASWCLCWTVQARPWPPWGLTNWWLPDSSFTPSWLTPNSARGLSGFVDHQKPLVRAPKRSSYCLEGHRMGKNPHDCPRAPAVFQFHRLVDSSKIFRCTLVKGCCSRDNL